MACVRLSSIVAFLLCLFVTESSGDTHGINSGPIEDTAPLGDRPSQKIVNARIVSASYDSVAMEWDPGPGADATFAQILRSRSAYGPYRFVDIVPPGISFYTDNGLEPLTQYYYNIRECFNNGVCVELTRPFYGSTTIPVPAAVESQESNSLTITWPSSSLLPAEKYEVSRGPSSDHTLQKVGEVVGSVTEFTDIGLDPETTYYFKIDRINDVAKGSIGGPTVPIESPSKEFHADVLGTTLKAYNGHSEVLSATKIKLIWNPSSGSASYRFDVRRRLRESDFGLIATLVGYATSYVDVGLCPNELFIYEVEENGVVPPENEFSARTLPSEVDINGDCVVDIEDLFEALRAPGLDHEGILKLLNSWGESPNE